MATGRKSRRSGIRDLLSDLDAFERDPASAGYDLRLDLAEIILRHLDGKNWTQKKLAEAAGMKSPFITRITHAAQNCTFDVAGRLLFALGIKAKLVLATSDTLGTAFYVKNEPVPALGEFMWVPAESAQIQGLFVGTAISGEPNAKTKTFTESRQSATSGRTVVAQAG